MDCSCGADPGDVHFSPSNCWDGAILGYTLTWFKDPPCHSFIRFLHSTHYIPCTEDSATRRAAPAHMTSQSREGGQYKVHGVCPRLSCALPTDGAEWGCSGPGKASHPNWERQQRFPKGDTERVLKDWWEWPWLRLGGMRWARRTGEREKGSIPGTGTEPERVA